jgi:pyruvate,orthophosphate dikinase
MAKRPIYYFDKHGSEGSGEMKQLLGGKGANLAEMCNLKLPVPPGFIITTEVCKEYYENKQQLPKRLLKAVDRNLRKLEKASSKKFGNIKNPLLVSVRSGAAVSMPGMMDTILNLGLNDAVVNGLSEKMQNGRFAWDCYRRFIQMFGNVARGIPARLFDDELENIKIDYAGRKGIEDADSLTQEELNKQVPDTALGEQELRELVSQFRRVYKEEAKKEFPEDPKEQLLEAVKAVFGSWNTERAKSYREIHHIEGLLGTAVNVQMMVYGNIGEDSGTGVGFTRNPSTGDATLYGEYLMNAQGEDVVAGIRTPLQIIEMKKKNKPVYRQLNKIREKLEKHFRDMQDFEFTIERNELFMLQTRTGKRTPHAAVKIVVDMVGERLIDKKTALRRVDANQVESLLHPRLDPKEEKKNTIFSDSGLPASPGAAVGQVVFTADDAEEWKEKGKEVILCRPETSPEDIRGMHAANGILTVRGGMTSHAAVVARGMAKCCVVGAGDIAINEEERNMHKDDVTVKEGDWICLNGSRGVVYLGKIELMPPGIGGPFETLMMWADEWRKLGVRANADTPRDAEASLEFGAEGIGLCRTEHMFFKGERINFFREVILAATEVKSLRNALEKEKDGDTRNKLQSRLQGLLEQYRQSLNKLLPLQRDDFESIFKILNGRPCTIRLLDPPLHEFLPQDEKGLRELARSGKRKLEEVRGEVESLREQNPMLGLRGCRLGISYPEIAEMQSRAIVEAACNVASKKIKVEPEIMVPLVGNLNEFEMQKRTILDTLETVRGERKLKKLPFSLSIGTMIEVPRAAVTAGDIARSADFFSFGTNDLTQMTCGFSRDDAGSFLAEYVRKGIYERDPFQSLDQSGVGKLIAMAAEQGKKTKSDLKVGICGEHGGDPISIPFFHKAGLDYVSCSSTRIPVARLSAAQAAIEEMSEAGR